MRMMQVVSKTLYRISPSMMFELIKKKAIETVPFAQHVGVEALAVGNGFGDAKLVQRYELTNHIATLHAAALFALAEAASGLAMAGTMAPVIMAIRPVAKKAAISFSKPAKGTIIAKARTMVESDAIFEQLNNGGKAEFDIKVKLFNEVGAVVCEVDFCWHITYT